MEAIKALVISLLTLLLIGFVLSVYTVNSGQQGLILKLGKIATDDQNNPKVYQPGLHFKLPIIEHAQLFDTRLRTFEPKPSRIVTSEQKDVLVDYFVKWRISDPAVFYTANSGLISRAERLMEEQLNDKLRAEIGNRTIEEVISDDRLEIMKALQEQANISAREFGIGIVDVRIKRIDLPTEVSAAVFNRMRSERSRVATEHRASGHAKAENIRTKAQAKATVLVAQAKQEAARVKAEGDETAAAIYAEAYSKDPEFYEFYRSMLAYRDTFVSKRDILVLRPDSQFFKYFGSADAKQKSGT